MPLKWVYPKQSKEVGKQVDVYLTKPFPNSKRKYIEGQAKRLRGIMVRDDMEEPYETIISLADGRYVRGVECIYTFQIKD